MEVTILYTAIFFHLSSCSNSDINSLYRNVCSLRSTCDGMDKTQGTNTSSGCTYCFPPFCRNTISETCCQDYTNDSRKNVIVCKELIFHSPSRGLERVIVPVVSACLNVSSAYSEACETGRFITHYDPRVALEETDFGVILFLNRYCAFCNDNFFALGLESSLYCNEQFQTTVLADVQDVFEFVEKETNCIISQTISDEIILPKCIDVSDELFDFCNLSLSINDSQKYPTTQKNCRFNKTLFGNSTYNDRLCCFGNGTYSENERSCLEDYQSTTVDPSLRFVAVLNFFPVPMTTSGTGQVAHTCNGPYVYDGIQASCRPAVCPEFEQFQRGGCIYQYVLLQDATFRVKVMLLPNATIGINGSGHVFAQTVFDRINSQLTQSFVKVNLTLVSNTVLFRSMNHQDNGYFEVESAILDIYVRPWNTVEISVTEKFLLKRDFYKFVISYEERFIGFDDTVIYGGEEVDTSLEDGKIRFWGISVNGDLRKNSLILPLNPTNACPFVEYEESWFKIISNWQILLLNSGVTFNRTQYMVKGLRIRLCSWYLSNIVIKLPKTTSAFEIVDEVYQDDEMEDGTATATAVVQCIGLVCLIITFVTYSLFSELRTLPGKNLMFLVFSMFMAHVSFIVGTFYTDRRVVCTILGIVMHYWWLTAFAWMFVCSFDVFRALRSVVPRHHGRENSSVHLRYCVFAFVVPFIIVFAVCTINLIQTKGRTIGYSLSQHSRVCFVSTVLASTLTFSLPITICIIHNIVFLVCACVSLKRASRLRRSLQKKEMNFLSHCCKLSTLTGVSWALGFVATFTRNRYVALIFVLLSAGQGVFLFLAFAVNRRVFRLYVAFFRKLYSFGRLRGRRRVRDINQVRNIEQTTLKERVTSGDRTESGS